MCIQRPVALIVTRMDLPKMISRIPHRSSLVFLLLFFCGIINGHSQEKYRQGTVSYISGENIYVKFETTAGIENGDTLFVFKEQAYLPALVVQHRSSISCLCTALGDLTFNTSDLIFNREKRLPKDAVVPVLTEQELPEKDVSQQVLTSAKPTTQKKSPPDFSGKLRLSSYSNFSNVSDDMHRFRYTFSALATNVSGSKLSAETYLSFTHKLNEWNVVQGNLNNALKIYSLALRYDFTESTSLWLGRKINPHVANVGAVDGVQFEYDFKNFYAGVIAGSRPDYYDYGYNFDLFEYGVYFGHSQKVEYGFVQSSLAFFEQRNSGNVDRRFVYLQHTNSAIKNLNLFSSFEIDLYKLENDQPKNTLSLTSLYLSANYRFSKRISLFASYDNRKNVIYYETFRNITDEILQQASRQGVRVRMNFRPINYLIVSASAGTRFSENDPRPTKTVNGFVTWSRLPGIKASLSLSGNLMQTSYLDGQVYGARLSKDLIDGRLYSMIYYRWVDFNYVNSLSSLKQNIGEIDFSYRFNKSFYFSVNFEATIQEKDIFNRLYLSLRKNF